MSKRTKIWLIIATSLILIGSIIFVSVMKMCKWDFTKLSTVKYETLNFEINEEVKEILVTTDTADIVFLPSENENGAVVCYQQKNMPHSVYVKDGMLIVKATDERKWYEHIGISFGTPKITVYLPKGEYGKLIAKCSTGNIELSKDFTFGNIELKTSTGKITVSDTYCEKTFNAEVTTGKVDIANVNCGDFISSGNTGEVYLEKVIAKNEINITRSTGNIKFNGCDAKKFHFETNTGDVKGSLLSEKVFVAKTDTGAINVPKTTTGGLCEITTDTGDIDIILQK